MNSNGAGQKRKMYNLGIGISTCPVVFSSVVESLVYGNVDCNMVIQNKMCGSRWFSTICCYHLTMKILTNLAWAM